MTWFLALKFVELFQGKGEDGREVAREPFGLGFREGFRDGFLEGLQEGMGDKDLLEYQIKTNKQKQKKTFRPTDRRLIGSFCCWFMHVFNLVSQNFNKKEEIIYISGAVQKICS